MCIFTRQADDDEARNPKKDLKPHIFGHAGVTVSRVGLCSPAERMRAMASKQNSVSFEEPNHCLCRARDLM